MLAITAMTPKWSHDVDPFGNGWRVSITATSRTAAPAASCESTICTGLRPRSAISTHRKPEPQSKARAMSRARLPRLMVPLPEGSHGPPGSARGGVVSDGKVQIVDVCAGEESGRAAHPRWTIGDPVKTSRARLAVLSSAAGRGVVAGLLGVAAMTATEKVEQSLTRRPNSYVPARTLLTLLGRNPDDDDRPLLWNHAMHWGTGALLGALSGVWAATGLRGPRAYLAHTVVRLAFDQTVENATGVGAPPWTWPIDEQVIDLLHKAIYAFATGAVADRLVAGPAGVPEPRKRWTAR